MAKLQATLMWFQHAESGNSFRLQSRSAHSCSWTRLLLNYTSDWTSHSPSFFFCARIETSSPLGRSSRNSTASSRMMFAKSTLFTCKCKTKHMESANNRAAKKVTWAESVQLKARLKQTLLPVSLLIHKIK